MCRCSQFSSFPGNCGRLQRMEEASQLMVGEFDFRNFCRIDKNEARLEMSYVRRIHNVSFRHRG